MNYYVEITPTDYVLPLSYLACRRNSHRAVSNFNNVLTYLPRFRGDEPKKVAID